MIIPSLKTAFIDVPKTGSTSINYFLRKTYKDFPTASPDPLWWCKECSQQMSHLLRSSDNVITNTPPKTRHHPLISYYKNIPDFYDFLYFSVVRHPFDRFKSFVYETLLHLYFNKKLHCFSTQGNDTYPDPWFINSNKSKDYMDVQLRLILSHFHFINLKGFKNVNLCSMPMHMWPQNYFLTLKTLLPYQLRILKIENLKEWEYDFKLELSRWGGLNVTNEIIPNLDPSPYSIFLLKSNPTNKLTIPHDEPWAVDFFNPSKQYLPDEGFEKLYPTYDLFIQRYNELKLELDDTVLPILEEHRNLIESVYHEDMVTYGYA
jgi:hypothetical protein